MAKPFLKWAGGKGKILRTLEQKLPPEFLFQGAVTYIEPFCGGGAMLFHMLATHPNINRAIINDVNPALINCYLRIRNNHQALIRALRRLENAYYENVTYEEKRNFYNERRDEYNQIPVNRRNTIHAAALFIFFNRTCFNGLYRENRRGEFNVPFGRYVQPKICNEAAINEAHDVLQRVEIYLGGYEDILQHVNWNDYNFFYLDPPYRPLYNTTNFNSYSLQNFGDAQQEELKAMCDVISENGGLFMLSNSDSELEPGVNYFERLYNQYFFERVLAPRNINVHVTKREKATEVLIRNYEI